MTIKYKTKHNKNDANAIIIYKINGILRKRKIYVSEFICRNMFARNKIVNANITNSLHLSTMTIVVCEACIIVTIPIVSLFF